MVDFNPAFEITIDGTQLEAGITQFIDQVEYESVDGIPDEIRLTVHNPEREVTKRRIFALGSEISLWIGAGHVLWYAARARIEKIRPRFANSGPTLEVVAYTKDYLMSRNSPPTSLKKKKDAKHSGRVFPGSTMTDAIAKRAESYGFKLDVDFNAIPDEKWSQLQPVGMTDFEFVQGFANQYGCIWWVDGDETGAWTFHFKDPDRTKFQYTKQTFHYDSNDGNFEYDGEQAFEDLKTSILVSTKNADTRKIMTAEVEADDVGADDGRFNGDLEALALNPKSPTEVTIGLGDVKVDVIAGRAFTDEKQMKAWATAWFKRHAERFISARIQMPGLGLDDMRANQVHALEGMGDPWDGDYFFTRVRHSLGAGQEYKVDADVRKIFT